MDGFQAGAGPRPAKFSDPEFTLDGAQRAVVAFKVLETLRINTGTLCNIECANCYIESGPANDRLAYITLAEATPFIEGARAAGAREIGFTGGEPFMNPHMIAMAAHALDAGLAVLVLTNAMAPMLRASVRDRLGALIESAGPALRIRVSLDHYSADRHDRERGSGAFEKTLEGLHWLAGAGARLSVAGRAICVRDPDDARAGYDALFKARGLPIDAADPAALVIFPEMSQDADPPEISTDCWALLDKSPSSVMCATSRMVVKRKGAPAPAVLACTLIPYDERFEMGPDLKAAARPVALNHPHCASFCVLGGSSCSG